MYFNRTESLLVTSSNIININVLLVWWGISGDFWLLIFEFELSDSPIRNITIISRWDEHPLKLCWCKHHSMMFINKCMYLSDQDSDAWLYRLLSEPVFLTMNLEWSVNLLIKSQLGTILGSSLQYLHLWKTGIKRMSILEPAGQTWLRAKRKLECHYKSWKVNVFDIDWVVTECSNLIHLIGCKYSIK